MIIFFIGKQLFETNENLFKDVSEETSEGAVEIDEKLFQDIEDLDIDDDEDDEWNPDDETDEE